MIMLSYGEGYKSMYFIPNISPPAFLLYSSKLLHPLCLVKNGGPNSFISEFYAPKFTPTFLLKDVCN